MCWGAIVGGGIAGVSAANQNKNAQATLKQDEKTANRNAKMQDAEANRTSQRAADTEGFAMVQGAQFAGTQRASIAASGLRTDSGTPLDILADTAGMIGLDARTQGANIEQQAYGHRIDAWNSRGQARTLLAQRINKRNVAQLEVEGAIMGGAQSGAAFQSSMSSTKSGGDNLGKADYSAPTNTSHSSMRGANGSGSYAGTRKGYLA